MRRAVELVAVLAGILLFNAPAFAQGRPQTREGFFIGLGLGWGSLGCSECEGERESGPSPYLKLGGTVNDQLLLGVESNGWLKEDDGVTVSMYNYSAAAYFYPSPASGLFLKGGLGLSMLEVDPSGLGTARDTGFGLIGGIGYDARVGRNFSLTPYANVVYGRFDGESANVLQAGLGVTWH